MTQPECPKPVRWNQPAGLTGNWRGLSHAIGKGQPGAQPLRFELVRVNIVPQDPLHPLESKSKLFGRLRVESVMHIPPM